MNSFKINPAIIELLVKPGGRADFYIYITNNTGHTATFDLGAEDLSTGDTSGQDVTLLGTKRGAYSLKDYILAPSKRVTLANDEASKLSFAVSLPSDVSDKGLYGAITIGLANNSRATMGAIVHSRIAVGVLVRTVEHPVVAGHLADFDTVDGSHVVWTNQPTFKIGYTNDGNVHMEPTGVVTLSDIFGRVSASEIIPNLIVLPGNTRSETLPVTGVYLLGRYVATLTLTDGQGGHRETRQFTLWVLPWQLLLLVAILVCAVLVWLKFRKV